MLKNPEKTVENVVQWIREYFESSMPNACAVLGISGGKDSSVAAALCAKALGKDRVVGITMPDGIQPDIDDSHALIRHLGIRTLEVNIGKITSAFSETFSELPEFETVCGQKSLSKPARINYPPRIRMSVLYAVAQSLPAGGLVVNTCNRSEDYVGYSTKFGDAAGDFSPMAAFTVHEVLQLGEALGLPQQLVHKAPSDGLSGMTDEEKLGFTYAELDHYLDTGVCGNSEAKEKIDRLHRMNLHKLQPMPHYEKNSEE
ncbi:MAG: NAD(+) synthase [Eubacteriales bacterium]|nr:NAD(+) synthase [Eubacteriales bacterium]